MIIPNDFCHMILTQVLPQSVYRSKNIFW